jgi:uncharacterized surface protein with fasciclin (FAS1) repeats
VPALPDIVTVVGQRSDSKRFLNLLTATGLRLTLKGAGPFTVFVPADQAFERMSDAEQRALLAPDPDGKVKRRLGLQVVPGRYTAEQLARLATLDTLNGQRIRLSTSAGALRVAGARVITTDIACGNGIIHVVDAFAQPAPKTLKEMLEADPSVSEFYRAVQASGLGELLQQEEKATTLLVPTNAAILKLPADEWNELFKPGRKDKLAAFVKRHMLVGRCYADVLVKAGAVSTKGGDELEVKEDDGRLSIGGSKVLGRDLEARNGVIQILDAALQAPKPEASDGH